MKQSQIKPKRKRKCKHCGDMFEPFNSMQATCTKIECCVTYGKKLHKKQYKAETKELKKKQKDNDRSYWLDKAQKSCNAYIRERDKNQPCISCGTTNPDIQYCAGHYKTRGAHPELRFHPLNIHKQCNHSCNLKLSGNIQGYRTRLIEKIGLSAVEWLEGAHKAQKFTINDLKEIDLYYRDLRKSLQTQPGN